MRAARAILTLLLFAGLVVLSPTHTAPASAGPSAGRVLDPTVAYDAASNRWVSLSSGESLSSQGATACAPVDPVIQARGWFNVPIRTGPTPDKLRGCWEGDALRDPPAGWWAEHEAGSVRAPTLLKVNGVWWMMYSARKSGSQQRCIGIAASDQPTGPWYHGNGAFVCPPDGASVDYPELFYNRDNQKVYLLWSQSVMTAGTACSSQIKAQEFDTVNGVLVGTTPATILDASEPIVGFDEIAQASCPDGTRDVVENPTMLRGNNGTLWLLFSANDRNSVNYATGWAVCGGGAPGSQGCAILNGYDPVQPARYRPMWGDGTRTAPVGGVNAKPYAAFPNYQGFGGLSVAVADPTAPPTGVTYVVGQLFWQGDQHLPLSYRVDTTQTVPGIYETEAVALHGTAGTFGSVASTPPAGTTPSGHGVTTRDVATFGPAPGYEGIFNAVASNGTAFVSQGDQNRYFPTPTNDGMALGAYDPASSKWTNVQIKWNRLSNKNTVGTTTLPAVHPNDYAQELPWESASPAGAPIADDVRQVGASLGDVQEIDDGKGVAFVAPGSYPFAYGWLNGAGLPLPSGGADGTWPAFGIVSQVNGTWQVASGSGWVNQWTGGQLRASVPRDPAHPEVPSISEQACPTTTDWAFGAPLSLPADESLCLHPNELDEFPDSRDVIVAQYGGGLMALKVTPQAGGRYDVAVNGFYKFDPFPTPSTTDDDDMIIPAAKTVDVDPTGVAGDERFVVQFDLFLEKDGNPETFDGTYGPGVVIEFSYDQAGASLTPVSAPLLSQSPLPNQRLGGLGGLYDSAGNFWAQGGGWPSTGFLGVYAKTNGQRDLGTSACGFVPGTPLSDYYTEDLVAGTRVWGKVCQPDYEIVQARPFTERWGGVLMLTEDPATKTMVAHDYWYSGALAVRRSGTGGDMTFQVGNLVDTGETRLAPGVEENRPGVFDASGRYWFASPGQTPGPRPCSYSGFGPLVRLCPNKPAYFSQQHWMTSIDVPQLFATPPVVLPTTTQAAARLEAEATATIATQPGSASNGVIPIDSTATMRRSDPQENNGDAGFELLGASSGTVEYKVWVPVAGSYRLKYRVRGGGGIQASVGTTTYPTTSVTNPDPATPATATTTGSTIQLQAGLQTIRLNATSGSTWVLNWFDVTRV